MITDEMKRDYFLEQIAKADKFGLNELKTVLTIAFREWESKNTKLTWCKPECTDKIEWKVYTTRLYTVGKWGNSRSIIPNDWNYCPICAGVRKPTPSE